MWARRAPIRWIFQHRRIGMFQGSNFRAGEKRRFYTCGALISCYLLCTRDGASEITLTQVAHDDKRAEPSNLITGRERNALSQKSLPGREANLMKSRKMRQFSISQMKEFDDSKQTGNLQRRSIRCSPPRPLRIENINWEPLLVGQYITNYRALGLIIRTGHASRKKKTHQLFGQPGAVGETRSARLCEFFAYLQ